MPGHKTKYNLMEPSKLILLPHMRPLNPASFVRELSKKGNISNVKRKRVERERERENANERKRERKYEYENLCRSGGETEITCRSKIRS